MNHTERRQQLHAILAGTECLSPASVYDPLSARVAEAVGFKLGLLSGSVVSATTLPAPDLIVHTVTEYAEQIRRITRVTNFSLFVDADHGYGNALNVMRTVREFEHAGVCGIGIEDTAGPLAFGQKPGTERLVSIEEGVAKMRAAVAAREDPALAIFARSPALKFEGMESAVARARAYAATGVDALWIRGIENRDQLLALRAAGGLPIVIGSHHGSLTHQELAACGARIALQGHLQVPAVVKALRATYTHLFNGGAPADLKPSLASRSEMDQLLSAEHYQQCLREFMQ